MMTSIRRSFVFPLALLVAFFGTGCESSVDSSDAPDLSAETKAASAILPADARMTAMVDLKSLRENGPDRVREMVSDGLMAGASEQAARMEAFLEDSGIDPSTDIDRMYMAVSEENGRETPSFVVYGSFDRDRVEESVRSSFGDDLTQTVHDRTTIFEASADRGKRGDKTLSFAVVNNDMIVGSASTEGVTTMLDRQGSTTSDDEFVRLASQGQTVWFVARDIDAPKDGDRPAKQGWADMRKLGRAVQTAAGSFSLAQDGTLDGQMWLAPRSGASSDDVADVAQGALAAAKQRAQDEPAWTQMLDDVTISSQGERVAISVRVPSDLLNEMARGMDDGGGSVEDG